MGCFTSHGHRHHIEGTDGFNVSSEIHWQSGVKGIRTGRDSQVGLAGRRLNSHARAKLHNDLFNVAYNLRYHFIVTINSEEIS